MKVLNSAVVKAQIKVVIEDLEEVLRELKKVAAELRVIIDQIDDITARIDQEEARMKSLQLVKGREDRMSLSDPRGRPNGQPKVQTAHCSHISDITGGARSRTRCEYPDILVSSPPQFQHLRETAIVDSHLYYSLGGEGGSRQYNTIDTSQLRKMQPTTCVETKSQTLRTRTECRYSPVGAECSAGEGPSRKSCTLDRRRDSLTSTRLVTMRNGPIRTDCAVTSSSTSVSKLIESEEALETCRQDTHSYVLHGTRLMHTCSGKDCGGHRDVGGDSDSVRTIESTERLVRSRTRNEEYSCGDSIASSSTPVYDETVSMMKKSTSGCFSCAAASNTDSYEELAVTSCLTTRRTWRSQTVSDARRRFFRPKVELRNGTGIRYHTMDENVVKADTHLRGSGGAHSVLSGSQTWLVSTGSQTTEDISDVEADERVKNYLRDFVNLRDEITKL